MIIRDTLFDVSGPEMLLNRLLIEHNLHMHVCPSLKSENPVIQVQANEPSLFVHV